LTGARVSVLMPTFKQAWSISRALDSLLCQEFTDWELIIVDDGSPDDTDAVTAPYRTDSRIRYLPLDRNIGLGAALNLATEHATGEYLAYLPSDDVYFPHHLTTLVAALDADEDVYLAYGGVVCNQSVVGWQGPTLQGADAVGREPAALRGELSTTDGLGLRNGNLLALVQVMHRRTLGDRTRWVPRSEQVSDYLERDFWLGLVDNGARFAWAGRVSCEWTDHPDQRHKVIGGSFDYRPGTLPVPERAGRGLSGYRTYYGIPRGEALNWVSSASSPVDERRAFAAVRSKEATPPRADGLRILIVGGLAYNPDRIQALEEDGHELFGLWSPYPALWDRASTLPFGRLTTIPTDRHWRDRIREVQPDVVYALLNHHALPLIDEVLSSGLDIPTAFHFKESAFSAMRFGMWQTLRSVLGRSAGHIFISEENHEWFRIFFPDEVGHKPVMLLDGELPKIDWMTDDWAPRLSDADGEVHTVCLGRPIGLEDLATYTAAGIHVHFYGEHFHTEFRDWIDRHRAQDRLHLHPWTISSPDWVRELSRYDAGWLHLADSDNGGRLRAARWSDLNVPSRLTAYMAAGLPTLLKDTSPSTTAVRGVTDKFGVGLPFRTPSALRDALADRSHMARLRSNVRGVRHEFAFDTHVDELVSFFRTLIHR